jgi:hypothetical protein
MTFLRYHRGSTIERMAGVVKRSVSMPQDVFDELEQEAAREGLPLSTALTEAAQQWLVVRRGLREVTAWEREHGAFSEEELAAADAVLDAATRVLPSRRRRAGKPASAAR